MLGIHSTYLGSRYLHYAITLCLNNEDYLLCVCHLYDIVASNFGVEAILKWIIRITALILMCIVGSFAFYGWLVWQYM